MAMTDPGASEPFPADPGRRGAKSAGAFRTISEVASDLNVPQHVLRFWETRFTQIRPLKRAGGRRYYRPEDVELLRRIRDLIYRHGYTIRGAQRLLREQGRTGEVPPPPPGEAADPDMPDLLDQAEPQAPPPPPHRASAPPAPVYPAPAAAGLPAQLPQAAAPPARRAPGGDHIGEVIAELTALRDLLRSRTKR